MANRFSSPDQQFVDEAGVPYAGGQLFFYATGTSTPQNTYSDSGLTIANTNPVILDSSGCAGSVFLQNLAYKVVLEDVNSVQVWTFDPVYSSDYSTYAQFQAYNGNPNGFVAGNAGTVGTLPGTSAVWDYVDKILYVCTTTGNAASAVWTAVNANAAAPVVPTPQGYLTLNSDPSNPVLTTDMAAATSIYYTPYVGNLISVFNGSSFITTTFTQLTLALSTSQVLSTVYDVFVFSNSGVLTLVTGPAWSNSGAGTGSRGTGSGSSAIQRLNGLWVNAVQITGVNGSNTYTVPANTATYLGSIYVDTTAGQVSCYRSWGASRKWGVWNCYNRTPISLLTGDTTSSWAYTTNTIRESNGSTTNTVAAFAGLAEEEVSITFVQNCFTINVGGVNSASTGVAMGIGWNITTAFSGTQGTSSWNVSLGSGIVYNASVSVMHTAQYSAPPSLGVNNATCLEKGNAAILFAGTQANMVLTANYRG